MYRIRTTKTGSGKTAVQVVVSVRGQTKVMKHIGSADDPKVIAAMTRQGQQYIETTLGILPLFSEFSSLAPSSEKQQILDSLRVYRTLHTFAYEVMDHWYTQCGFGILNSLLLKDLVIMRLIEPSSKLRALMLLERYFGRTYAPRSMYRTLKTFTGLKDQVQTIAVDYAQKHLGFDFRLVFYDVTTLYFETFTDDELRKCGFSKDHKANQPQIIVGLLVTTEGFPIAYTVAEGNTFEGKTMTPLILAIQKTFHLERLTVVADAAMLSEANLQDLKAHHLDYIVGARIANLSLATVKEMSHALGRREKVYFRKETNTGSLLCDYSSSRAAKDKSDRQKQLARAKAQMATPEKLTKRSRFLHATGKTTYAINQALIEKDALLDGIKGYYTSLSDTSPSLIVSRYHDLWHIEKSFRIAKSDLLARPIYHFRKANIQAHILLVFMSLCLAKSLELSTGLSLRTVKDLLWEIQDLVFEDEHNQAIFTKRMDIRSKALDVLLGRIGFKTY